MTNILDLTGKELEAALKKIMDENIPIHRPWTPKEADILKRLWASGVPVRVIAKQLNRTYDSVRNKARAL